MNIVLTTYPNDKPSGVAWLGEVPSHWEVLSLKRLGSFKSGAGFPVEHQGQEGEELPFFKVSDMNLPGNDKFMNSWNNSVSHSTATRLGAPIFPPGSIVFPKVGGAMLTNKRRVLTRPSCIDNNLMGCVVTRGNHGFVLLLLQNIDLALIAKPGPVPAISEGEIGEIRVTLPPLPEQRAIAYYLDHVDRRMRLYVTAKRKLIALLEEEKQAIINRAVTRGLDPNVRLKPSGVEWLGDVPEHWGVRRAKFFYREVDERSTTGTEELMSVSHITGVTPRKKTVTMFLAESNIGYKLCRPGDIVINTMWAYMAALGVARQNGLVSPSYGVYRSLNTERLNHDYIDSLLRTEAYRTNYLIRSTGITSSRLRLYPESFLDIPLLCPPTTEQDAIVEHLERATATTNAVIARARRQIELLEEYRTRLIADVVTGRLDVREAAAQLPEEPDDQGRIEGNGQLTEGMDKDLYDADASGEELAMESEVTV